MKFLQQKLHVILPIFLVFVSFIFLSHNINRTFVDSDEATYAKVVVDTMQSGQLISLKLSGNNWFDKPPLYFWLAMAAVHIFGPQEFAFRLPGIINSILCLLLVYFILRKFTGNFIVSALGFFILLFSPPFFVFAMEVRLDSGVIFSILLAFYFLILGWEKEKYLSGIFPAIAVGFLFKSVIAFLAVPIILIYSLLYKKWTWLKSKYLWLGLIPFVIVLAPWHIIETIKFGRLFWDNYLGVQIFHRSVSTITGANNYYDYLHILWTYDMPWAIVIPAVVIAVIITTIYYKKDLIAQSQPIASSLISALFILIIFTIARTHLPTYILPALPFFAIFIAVSLYSIYDIFKWRTITKWAIGAALLVLLAFAGIKSFTAINDVTPDYNEDQRKIAEVYKKLQVKQPGVFYSFMWPYLETLSYYSGTKVQYTDKLGPPMKPPLYFVTPIGLMKYMFKDQNTPLPGYDDLKIMYVGDHYILVQALY